MLAGALVLIAVIIAVTYVLYQILVVVGVIAAGVLFICISSLFYIFVAVTGSVMFLLFEQFGRNNGGLLWIISLSIGILVSLVFLKYLIKELTNNTKKFQRWVGRA